MKKYKIIIFLLLGILFYSCSSNNEVKYNESDEETIKKGRYEYKTGLWSSMNYKIEEVIIDDCEYIIIFGSEGRNIIHKANCRNDFHNKNK